MDSDDLSEDEDDEGEGCRIALAAHEAAAETESVPRWGRRRSRPVAAAAAAAPSPTDDGAGDGAILSIRTPAAAAGFVDRDGRRRRYDAPAPPKDIPWQRMSARLMGWTRDEGDPRRLTAEDVDGGEQMTLMDLEPGDDDLSAADVAASMRETEELLRAVAICREDDGSPRRWTRDAERELCGIKYIKLSDSMTLDFTTESGALRLFGVRAFQVVYRFFVVVVLAGDFRNIQSGEDDGGQFLTGDKRFVGYYYVAKTPEQALIDRCV